MQAVTFAKLLNEVRDFSGDDNELYLPKDTVVIIESDEGGYVIAESTDGRWSFPLEYNEFEEIY